MIAFLRTQQRVMSLARTTQATRRALELELLNFKEGETDFTGVFVLQGDLVQKLDQLASSQGDVVTSLVNVYKAIGGGWEIRNLQPRGMTQAEAEVAREELVTPTFPMKGSLPQPMSNEE